MHGVKSCAGGTRRSRDRSVGKCYLRDTEVRKYTHLYTSLGLVVGAWRSDPSIVLVLAEYTDLSRASLPRVVEMGMVQHARLVASQTKNRLLGYDNDISLGNQLAL